MLSTWLSRWGLIPDGVPIVTHTSQLLPVTTINGGKKALLKLTNDDSERTGCQLMVWWDGKGAARVLAHEDGALLLERATGVQSLTEMSRADLDVQACRIKRERLLLWIAAWCGLSSAWFLQEGDNAAITLRVAELALAELDSGSLQL